jgi:hypothetical protein
MTGRGALPPRFLLRDVEAGGLVLAQLLDQPGHGLLKTGPKTERRVEDHEMAAHEPEAIFEWAAHLQAHQEATGHGQCHGLAQESVHLVARDHGNPEHKTPRCEAVDRLAQRLERPGVI